MRSTFATCFRSFMIFIIFTFTLSSMPQIESLLACKLPLFYSEAQAAETQEETPVESQVENQTEPSETNDSTPEREGSTLSVTDSTSGGCPNYQIMSH